MGVGGGGLRVATCPGYYSSTEEPFKVWTGVCF